MVGGQLLWAWAVGMTGSVASRAAAPQIRLKFMSAFIGLGWTAARQDPATIHSGFTGPPGCGPGPDFGLVVKHVSCMHVFVRFRPFSAFNGPERGKTA
jgi:hypothetical protein